MPVLAVYGEQIREEEAATLAIPARQLIRVVAVEMNSRDHC